MKSGSRVQSGWWLGVVLVAVLGLGAPAAFGGGEKALSVGEAEQMVRQMEALVGMFRDPAAEPPEFLELGDGLYAVSFPLSAQARERLTTGLPQAQVSMQARRPTIHVLAAGQAPLAPETPVAATHGVVSDATFPYTYWLITANLGSQPVTRATTLKLSGPGLKFNRSANVTYPANSVWGVFLRPGGSAGTPGIYTLQGTVANVGTVTTKTFAVSP